MLIGEVQPGKLAVCRDGRGIVRSTSFLGRRKHTQVSLAPMILDLTAPLPTTGNHTTVAGGVAPLPVRLLLTLVGPSQIRAAIVAGRSVDVIDLEPRLRRVAHDESLHTDHFAANMSNGISVAVVSPVVRQCALRVLAVDDGKPSGEQRNMNRAVRLGHAGTRRVPADTRAKLAPTRRRSGRCHGKGLAAMGTGTLNGHGVLQTLCRAPGVGHLHAGVSAVHNSTRIRATVRKKTATPEIIARTKAILRRYQEGG